MVYPRLEKCCGTALSCGLKLCFFEPLLPDSGKAISTNPCLARTNWRPPQARGTISKKQRRGVLDAAAWCRDVVYVDAGHTLQLEKVKASKKRKLTLVTRGPICDPDSPQFRAEVFER